MPLDGSHLPFQNLIQEPCRRGLREFHLGRPNVTTAGWRPLGNYGELRAAIWSVGGVRHEVAGGGNLRSFEVAKKILTVAPICLLRVAGALFYRHAE